MKRLKRFNLLLALLALVGLSAQTPKSKMSSCGLGGDHPCHCLKHVEEVQKEHMDACVAHSDKKKPSEALIECMAAMPDHCSIIERYGDWSTGDDGEHNHPMPNQCTSACKVGHCKCSDGPTCHIAHSPEGEK